MDGANERLSFTVVPQRLSQHFDPAAQCGFADDFAGPDCLVDFLFTDQTMTISYQQRQQLEDLRFHTQALAVTKQFETAGIQYEITE